MRNTIYTQEQIEKFKNADSHEKRKNLSTELNLPENKVASLYYYYRKAKNISKKQDATKEIPTIKENKTRVRYNINGVELIICSKIKSLMVDPISNTITIEF